jgi:hypothetical protein
MHFVFLNTSLNFIAKAPFKSDYAFNSPNLEPAGFSGKLWTTLSTELHGVTFSDTIIPRRFILISKFVFPYSIFPKYTTWLNYVFMLLTYVHFIDQFLTTLSLVSWNDIVSVIVNSDECTTKLSTHRHRIWLFTRKSQDESRFWLDKMAPLYRV